MDLVVANAGVTEIGKVLGDELDENGGLKAPNLKTLDVDLVGTIYCIFPFPILSLFRNDRGLIAV